MALLLRLFALRGLGLYVLWRGWTWDRCYICLFLAISVTRGRGRGLVPGVRTKLRGEEFGRLVWDSRTIVNAFGGLMTRIMYNVLRYEEHRNTGELRVLSGARL